MAFYYIIKYNLTLCSLHITLLFYLYKFYSGSNYASVKQNYGITNTHRDAFFYNMESKTRGVCLIFNHMHFDPVLQMNVSIVFFRYIKFYSLYD